MPDPHQLLNALEGEPLRVALTRCCGARRWVEGMIAARPFASEAALHDAAEHVWSGLVREDYLEAFSHHPRIGEDPAALRARFAETAGWAQGEQAGVAGADERTLSELAANNRRYFERFGYIFIVCASGKSAAQMAGLLAARLGNTPDVELAIAAREQARITRLRLEKLSP